MSYLTPFTLWLEIEPPVLISFVVRSFAFFAMVSLLVLALRRQSAATRHFVLATAMLGSLLVPLMTLAIPAWRVLPSSWSVFMGDGSSKTTNSVLAERNLPESEMLAASSESSQATVSSQVTPFGTLPYIATPQPSDIPADTEMPCTVDADASIQLLTEEPVARDNAWAWSTQSLEWFAGHAVQLCLAVWGVGIVLTLIPVAIGFIRLRRLYRRSQPLPPPLALQLASLAEEYCPGRTLDGRMTDVACLPMTWGFQSPVLLMPAELQRWSFERRQLVMLHELAHVRRFDYVTQLIGQVARSVYWFNPIAWYVLAQLKMEQEHAADDCVMEAGIAPEEYAAELLSITSRIPQQEWDTSLALAMGRKERLSHRLSVMLNPSLKRGGLNLLPAVITLGFIAGASCCVAICQPRAAIAVPPERNSTVPVPATATQPAVIHQDEVIEQASVTEPTVNSDEKPQDAKTPENDKAAEAPAKTKTRMVTELLERIENMSALPIDAAKLEEGAIRGILEALRDPHSQLISAEEFKVLSQHLEGRMAGIGVMLKQEASSVVIMQTLPNSVARNSGIQPGEILIKVNGTPVATVADAAKMIRGVVGTEITLSTKGMQANDEKLVTMTRGHVEIPMMQGWDTMANDEWSYWVDQPQGIAYLRILSFNQNLAKDLRRTVLELSGNGLRGLVLDLRDCGGGLFHEMVDVASCFMSDVPIVEVKSRQEFDSPLKTKPDAPFPDVPLVVLINGHTASAAEVVTAALQEQNRAIVIGERSFGKGTIQSFVPLGEGQQNLRLTVGVLTTPKGRALQRNADSIDWGVNPNEGFYVPLVPAQVAAREKRTIERTADNETLTTRTLSELQTDEHDAQLAAAVETLQSYLRTGKYAPTGKPLAEMKSSPQSISELLQEREQLRARLQDLEQKLEAVR